jgi:hypothetical protein
LRRIEGVFIAMNTRHETLKNRTAPIEMAPDDFRLLGHQLVDSLADWLVTMPHGLVTRDESVAEIRRALKSERGLPDAGESALPRPGMLEAMRPSLF